MPNITVNTIALPPDLYWQNEYNWSPVTLKEAVSIVGSSILQRGKRLDGRRISLVSGEETAWLTRAQLQALIELRDSLPTSVELKFGNAETYTVTFNDVDGQSIEAEAVQPGKAPNAGDYFKVKLNFLEAAA